MLEHLGDLHPHLLGLRERGSVLQLEDPQAVALVLLRNEGRRQRIEGDRGGDNPCPQTHQNPTPAINQPMEQTAIALLQARKEGVEAIKDQREATARKTEARDANDIGQGAKGGGAEFAKPQANHEPSHRPTPTFRAGWLLGLQNQPRHHRRERQRVKRRDRDRKRNRQGELPVDDADPTGIKRHRHKHRHQDQR